MKEANSITDEGEQIVHLKNLVQMGGIKDVRN